MLYRAASHVALCVADFYFLVSMHDVVQVWPVWCNACVSDSSCLNLATVFTSQDLSHSSFLFCCLALHMLLFCNLDLFRFVRNSWFVCVAFASAFFVCSWRVFHPIDDVFQFPLMSGPLPLPQFRPGVDYLVSYVLAFGRAPNRFGPNSGTGRSELRFKLN